MNMWRDLNKDGSSVPPKITKDNEEYYRELYFDLKFRLEQLRAVLVDYYTQGEEDDGD